MPAVQHHLRFRGGITHGKHSGCCFKETFDLRIHCRTRRRERLGVREPRGTEVAYVKALIAAIRPKCSSCLSKAASRQPPASDSKQLTIIQKKHLVGSMPAGVLSMIALTLVNPIPSIMQHTRVTQAGPNAFDSHLHVWILTLPPSWSS
jgi:hypothetical protein